MTAAGYEAEKELLGSVSSLALALFFLIHLLAKLSKPIYLRGVRLKQQALKVSAVYRPPRGGAAMPRARS